MPSLKLISMCLFIACCTSAQGQETDSSFVQVARNQAIIDYDKAIRPQAHVYDGNEYITHDHRIKIHPYYRVDSLQTGTVLYNGVQYDKVKMLYDIVRDELAIQPPESAYRLRLRNDHIARFSIASSQFTRLQGDSALGLPTGFYEVLHDGRVKALSHRVMIIHEDISQGYYKADYQQKDRFFILKDAVYHEVKTKRAFLALFPDQSKALRKYMRTQSLTFNNLQREEAIAKTVRYYETLL